VGEAVVRAAAPAPAERDELIEPSFAGIFRAGAAGFLREGFLPLGGFYAGLRLEGLAAGIAASAAASLAIYLYERRAGREGLLVRLSLAFVVVQSAIGLASNSTTVYLAQPVLIAAAWGLLFLLSIPLGRPLCGAVACAWYPFPHAFRETDLFKHVFGIQSLVWGSYFLGRSALRLALLLHGSLESFLAVTFVTGTPLMLLLLAWSIRHSIRSFSV
jgi:Protein of unknown function (DUF3159)